LSIGRNRCALGHAGARDVEGLPQRSRPRRVDSSSRTCRPATAAWSPSCMPEPPPRSPPAL
jgi:hypothetical protein